MVTQIAQRVETAANELLDAVSVGAATSDELREVLRVTRSVAAAVTAVQTTAAEVIARRERHGDGGAELLASTAGLAQRDARDRVHTVQAVRKVPELHAAVQAGEVSQANARRLADVITKTGSDAVAADSDLLKDAQTMRPEQFGATANRWIASQQADNGISQHAQQRARRYLRFFDTPDGMIGLHGEFDKITGQRIHNRLRQIATRLLNADKQLPKDQRREFPQCMADALQAQTSQNSSTHAGNRRTSSHAEISGHTTTDANSTASHRCCEKDTDNDAGTQFRDSSGGWLANITVMARVDDSTRDLIYELPDGSRLPPAVVEELTCNARIAGLVYDRNGDALWRTRSRRSVTPTQWQALLASYGGCFHCGASPSMCQAHHITPYSKGGATSLDNLIMVCWNCHHKIHHQNWQIHEHPNHSHTLHPPNNPSAQPRYGPAHNDDQLPALSHQTQKSRDRRERPQRRGQSSSRNGISAKARDPAPATLW